MYIHIRMYMCRGIAYSTLLSNLLQLSGIATSSIIEMYQIMYIHVPQGCFVIGTNARGVLDGGGFTDTPRPSLRVALVSLRTWRAERHIYW